MVNSCNVVGWYINGRGLYDGIDTGIFFFPFCFYSVAQGSGVFVKLLWIVLYFLKHRNDDMVSSNAGNGFNPPSSL